jgi:hypothetical protein
MKKHNKNKDYGGLTLQQFEPPSRHELRKGQLVQSRQGRDKGSYYLVIGCEGDSLFVVDGRKRGITNPKKKNMRHLQKSNRIAADLIAKTEGRQLRNEEVRAAITALLDVNNS